MEHDLIITYTMFLQKNKYKTLWEHPVSKHWHLINYGIVCAHDCEDVHITKTMTGANDCWTDHCLIHSSLPSNSHQNDKCGRKTGWKINIEIFTDPTNCDLFQQCVTQKPMNIKT